MSTLNPEAFKAAYQLGLSREELARHFGVQAKTISKWRKQCDLPAWRPTIDRDTFKAMHDRGMHRDELAKHYGITPMAVTRIRNQLGLPHDPSRRKPPIPKRIDRDEVKRLVKQNLTLREIADRLNCNEGSISRIKSQLGISHAYRGRPMTEQRLHAIWQMLYDGWSHEEIHRTEGANVETIRRHFPGTAWTFKQAGEHQAALRILNPHHFNAHPKHYDRAKIRAGSMTTQTLPYGATTQPRSATPEAVPSDRGGRAGRSREQVPGGVIGHPKYFEARTNAYSA